MLIVYSNQREMKSIKVFTFSNIVMRRLGLTRIYYWFNK